MGKRLQKQSKIIEIKLLLLYKGNCQNMMWNTNALSSNQSAQTKICKQQKVTVILKIMTLLVDPLRRF